ncbi:MAG TPA: hypothetical protein DCQ06_12830 [Myxococcales bacterium]|nr:hypothetical protein [Myxococcales bacterium]
MVCIGVAPHSVRAVPRPWLKELRDFDGPIHAHVAEQPAEVAACRERWGMSPLQIFAQAGLVDHRFTAVHMTHPDPSDAELLRQSRAGICACPTTEMDLGDGLLPLELREDISLCVGSDSHARIDLLAEARALEWHARALAGHRNVMAPNAERHRLGRAALSARLMRAATLDGSVALGASGQGLGPGQPADVCAIDLSRRAAHGVPPLEAAIFNSSPDWVTDVWVQGQRRVHSGELVDGLEDESVD